MKKFTRIIERNGHKYAYEITPYYDPKTKNTRQKTKYLGVYEEGEIKRKKVKIPVCVFDYGEFVPLLKIIDELKIGVILSAGLSEKHAHTLLALALNRATNPVAACNIRTWYEGTYLAKLYGDLPISSQNLSELMGTIGESPIPRDFSQALINNIGDGKPILYDITSLSSSSKLMDILEYGYNRDGDGLPQLNISIAAHKDLGIPLCFDVYPGSIVDVSTLRNTTKNLESLGLKNPTLVLDRGFFSETNLYELIEADFNFILPASFSSEKVRSLVAKAKREIEGPEYLCMFNGATIFVKPIVFETKTKAIEGYVFYDLKRENEEKEIFYRRLHDTRERLTHRKLRSYEKAGKVFEDIAGRFSDFFSWKVKDSGFEVKVKSKAISRLVNRMGFTVILCRGGFKWEDVLTWNRERDVIEKMFMNLKNDLEALPMRVQSTEVARGWIFVTFLALLIRCRLAKLLIESGLVKKYSIPLLLLTLHRLKQMAMSDGTMIKTEITKNQREIFESLGIEP